MNKSGFTLIELLIVIALLAVISIIAVPAIGGITGTIKDKMLEEKKEMIEHSATLLGGDIKGSIMASPKKYNSFPCKSFIVSDLVPDYLDKDNDNTCLTSESTESIGCIVDPRNEENYLDKYEVIIYYKNKRIYSILDTNDDKVCS